MGMQATTPSAPTRTVPTRRGSSVRACLAGCVALEDVHGSGEAKAEYVGQARLCALDLTVAGLAAEVVAHLPDVGDAGGGDRVALALEATGHVHGRLAVTPGGAAVEEVDGAALLPQPEVVVVH